MDDGLKQRLVGAVVIVALAVIFIPMFFSPKKPELGQVEVSFPAPPAMPERALIKPVEPEQMSPENAQSASEQAEAAGLPEAWVVQLASFQESANAETLRDKLRAAGYKSYVTYRPDQNDELARVFVGPELERKTSEALVGKLKEEFKLEGFVVRYAP